jgi:NAD(P)-dependent dehydrogenase (short-subunit alcohol dehydrogenase family)
MVSDSIMVKGNSRGIGLECIRQYADLGWHAYATCRRSAEADTLQKLARAEENVSVHRLNVTGSGTSVCRS